MSYSTRKQSGRPIRGSKALPATATREAQSPRQPPDFHSYCYAIGGPYNEWSEQVQALQEQAVGRMLGEAGVVPGDIWNIGFDYCKNEGRKTDLIRTLEEYMDPAWVSLAVE